MEVQFLFLIGFVATVAISLLIGSISRRGKNKTIIGFFWGDNSFSVAQGTHLNLSTSFAINGVLYSTWLGYRAGWPSVLPQVIWCAGFLFLSRYASRLSLLSRTGTLHGNIGYVHGKKAAALAAIASLIGFTLLFGWELFIGAGIFKAAMPMVSIDLENLIYFTLAGMGALYCMLGGMRGNLRANEFQNYLSGAALIVAIVFLVRYVPGTQQFSWADFADKTDYKSLVDELTTAGIITNLVLFSVYQFLDMSVWQNIATLSAKKKSAKRALLSSAFWIFIFPGVAGSALGMVMRPFDGITANNILTEVLNLLKGYPWVFVFLVMGFFAMMLSTVDGLLLAASQAATWDLFDRKTVLRSLIADGKPDLQTDDVPDPVKLFIALKNGVNPVAAKIYDALSLQAKQFLEKSPESLTDKENAQIFDELNALISGLPIYPVDYTSSYPSAATLNAQSETYVTSLLNRWYIEDNLPGLVNYNHYSQTLRNEGISMLKDRVSEKDLAAKESRVLDHTKLFIFLTAMLGGFVTLQLVRRYEVNNFNLIYITYVAQMALFPAIWSILHGEKQRHPRSAWAIGLGLAAGGISAWLGLERVPAMAMWSPVIAISVACIIHWPFRSYKSLQP